MYSIPCDSVAHIVNTFNTYHEKIQFIRETENENQSISFLDIFLTRKNNQIITDWYQKPTFSGRLLNYESNHPMHKKVVIA